METTHLIVLSQDLYSDIIVLYHHLFQKLKRIRNGKFDHLTNILT
jgi:hypothetical protein